MAAMPSGGKKYGIFEFCLACKSFEMYLCTLSFFLAVVLTVGNSVVQVVHPVCRQAELPF